MMKEGGHSDGKNAARLSAMLGGSAFQWLCVAAMVAAAVVAAPQWQAVADLCRGDGWLFRLPVPLIADTRWDLAAAVAANIFIAAMLPALNKAFQFVRAETCLPATAFVLMQAACPLLTTGFNTSAALALLVVVMLPRLFVSFRDAHAQRRIFLLFAVAAVGCMGDYALTLLFAIFGVGFVYMHCRGMRETLAALIGVVAALWIPAGFGLLDFGAALSWTPAHALWDALSPQTQWLTVGWTVAVALLTLTLTMINLRTTFNYRLRTRMYNAFFIGTSVLVVVAMAIDWRNFVTYLPTLHLCAAVQVGQTHTLYAHRHGFVGVLLLVAVCAGVYGAYLIPV